MDQTLVLVIFIVALVGFMFWSRWRARRQYQQQLSELQVGDEVMTIGGIYGKLTYLDREGGLARMEVAPGVEVRLHIGAISRRVGP
ncbi:MAG: preprotein translocase subunit YajC [Anaerolineae bacterium]|nr:preprotein translocase subunit YajC [Anaerolineae bacterium]MDW8067975.1 preprotein translocase subunit YajC [Anaerolineae bacterium]